MEWTTTTTLLRELRDYANEGAWETFVRRFRPPVTRFLRELGIVERDVEDVTQEVMLAFAQLYRAGRYDRERGRLSRWLFGIAYNHVLRQRRLGARRAQLAAGAGARLSDAGARPSDAGARLSGGTARPPDAGARLAAGEASRTGEARGPAVGVLDGDDAWNLWEQYWRETLLQLCLSRARAEFAPSTYGAFALVVLDQRTPQEAAITLALPVKAVYNAKHRVLKRMREYRAELEHSADLADHELS